MTESEYEYAEIEVHNHRLSSAVQFWANEGWDVVSATFAGGTHSAIDFGRALIRRKREGAQHLLGPGTQLLFYQYGAEAWVRRDSFGHWSATRNCLCPGKHCVARVDSQYPTIDAAQGALRDLRANDDAQALIRAGKLESAFDSIQRSLGCSRTQSEWLVHEIDPTFFPEFRL